MPATLMVPPPPRREWARRPLRRVFFTPVRPAAVAAAGCV
eukprot:gene18881-6661_t